jgi:(p)ppGpp synthase/HD superfamily hydrolase
MEEPTYTISVEEFLGFLENEARLRVDDFIKGAVEVAQEVHSGVKREDGHSSFLDTHTWPVAADVVRHYRSVNRNITSVEVGSAILHDILEDNDRILDLYKTKSYGFEAYLDYRFGNRIYRIATELKIPPLDNYLGNSINERLLARFRQYCNMLITSEYDMKTIKLADRINNMVFIKDRAKLNKTNIYEKIKRYLREAEDFYLSYTILEPSMPDYYEKMRLAYEQMRSAYYEQTQTMPQSQSSPAAEATNMN